MAAACTFNASLTDKIHGPGADVSEDSSLLPAKVTWLSGRKYIKSATGHSHGLVFGHGHGLGALTFGGPVR